MRQTGQQDAGQTAKTLPCILVILFVSACPVEATRIRDAMDITFPPGSPISPLAWILQSGKYAVAVTRTIQVEWSPDDPRQTLVLRLRDLPAPSGIPEGCEVDVTGSVQWRYSYGYSFFTFWVRRTDEPAKITIRYLLDPYYYVAIFGRVQARWHHLPAEGVTDQDRITTLRVPAQATLDYVEPATESSPDGAILSFVNATTGFVYFEEPKTIQASLALLVVLSVALLAFAYSRTEQGRRLRRTASQRIRTAIERIPAPSRRSAFAWFLVLAGVFLGLCLLVGPSPRVNVILFHELDPAGESKVLSASEERPQVRLFFLPRARQMELMNRFGMIDLILFEDWALPRKGENMRLDEILEDASKKGAVFGAYSAAEGVQERLNEFRTVEFATKEDVLRLLDATQIKKRQANPLHLGVAAHNYLAVALGIFSLALMAVGCFLVATESVRFEGDLILRTLKVIIAFFGLFLLFLALYIAGGRLLHMPIGFHGPSGSGITVLSLLGRTFGGGNWLRVISGGIGLCCAILVLGLAGKVRISFTLSALAAYLAVLFVLANPTVTPIFLRMIAGETGYTPPPAFASNRMIDAVINGIYGIHYTNAVIMLVGANSQSLVSEFSRGIAMGLAFVSFWAVLGGLGYASNSFLVPGTVLVVARLYARVGDMDLAKTMWVFPTGVMAGSILAAVALLVYRPILDFLATNMIGSHRHKLSLAYLGIAVSLAALAQAIPRNALALFATGSFILTLSILLLENASSQLIHYRERTALTARPREV